MNNNLTNKSHTTDFLTKKVDIEAWLFKYELLQYCSIEQEKEYGWVVNSNRDVKLNEKNLSTIPVKFNHIKGSFSIFDNLLTNLNFAPRSIEGGFCCAYNSLESLEGSPKIIVQQFDCSSNRLKNLRGGPEHVGMNYNCSQNEIDTLAFLPDCVEKEFFCNLNPGISQFHSITNLEKLKEAVRIDTEHRLISLSLHDAALKHPQINNKI